MKSYGGSDLILCVTLLICSFCAGVTESTTCKPLSTFKLDCNICICSKNGQEYTCPQSTTCPPPDRSQFIKEIHEDGYILLKPKPKPPKNIKIDDDDETFVLTRKLKQMKLTEFDY